MIWIDADVFFYRDVTEDWLAPLLPGTKTSEYVSYLGRDNSHSECGFMAFNRKASCHKSFFELFAGIYLSNAVDHLIEKHDSFIFDFLRKSYETQGYINKNITPKGSKATHVFVESPLGQRMDHLKGNRKNSQYSKENSFAKVYFSSN